MRNADMPAMPVSGNAVHAHGLTKREYIAAMAMQGMLSREETGSWKDFARGAVYAADALLAELERTGGSDG